MYEYMIVSMYWCITVKGKPFPSPSSVAVPESDPVNEERQSSSSEEAELEEADDLE